jgi:hypothetical protein
VRKLEDRIKEMELQLKQHDWANYVEDFICEDPHTIAAVDFHPSETVPYSSTSPPASKVQAHQQLKLILVTR